MVRGSIIIQRVNAAQWDREDVRRRSWTCLACTVTLAAPGLTCFSCIRQAFPGSASNADSTSVSYRDLVAAILQPGPVSLINRVDNKNAKCSELGVLKASMRLCFPRVETEPSSLIRQTESVEEILSDIKHTQRTVRGYNMDGRASS
jgi:hypothetical protein